MKTLITCSALLVAAMSHAQAFSPDGAFMRTGFDYKQAKKLDILAIVNVEAVEKETRLRKDGSLARARLITGTVLSGTGTVKGEKLQMWWPFEPGVYEPSPGRPYLVMAQRPINGHKVDNSGNLTSVETLVPSDRNQPTALALIPTGVTDIVAAPNKAEQVALNVARCISAGDVESIYRACRFLGLSSYPGGKGLSFARGRDVPPVGKELLRYLPSLDAAGRSVIYSLLAYWKVDGISESYLESLLEAGARLGSLNAYYKLGWSPATDLEYENLGRRWRLQPDLPKLWTGKIWVERLAGCFDTTAVNIAVMSRRVSYASPSELKPLLFRLDDPSVPVGVLDFISISLKRPDLQPEWGGITDKNKDDFRIGLKRAALSASQKSTATKEKG